MRIFILVIVFFLNVKTIKSQITFDIKARTDHSLNNYKVVFSYVGQNSKRIRDSGKVVNNTFYFKGTIDGACQLGLIKFVSEKKEMFWHDFVIDSGTNNFILRLDLPKKRIYEMGDKSVSNRIHETLDSIRRNEFITQRKKQNILDEVFSLTMDQATIMDGKFLDVLSSHPDNYYSILRLEDLSGFSDMRNQEEMLLKCYNKLAPELKSSKIGIEFYTKISERMLGKQNANQGSKMIDFQVGKIDGSIFKNSSLRKEPYMLVFSATWCIPCQEELPKLIELYNKFEDQGLKLVYFNLDSNFSAWSDHVRKNKTTWINVSERTKFKDSSIAKKLHITSVPTYLLINRDGEIVYNSDLMKGGLDKLALYLPEVLKASKNN